MLLEHVGIDLQLVVCCWISYCRRWLGVVGVSMSLANLGELESGVGFPIFVYELEIHQHCWWGSRVTWIGLAVGLHVMLGVFVFSWWVVRGLKFWRSGNGFVGTRIVGCKEEFGDVKVGFFSPFQYMFMVGRHSLLIVFCSFATFFFVGFAYIGFLVFLVGGLLLVVCEL